MLRMNLASSAGNSCTVVDSGLTRAASAAFNSRRRMRAAVAIEHVGLHQSVEHVQLGAARLRRHQSKFGAHLEDVERGRVDAKPAGPLRHDRRQATGMESHLVRGVDLEAGRPFEQHRGAVVERDFGQSFGELNRAARRRAWRRRRWPAAGRARRSCACRSPGRRRSGRRHRWRRDRLILGRGGSTGWSSSSNIPRRRQSSQRSTGAAS